MSIPLADMTGGYHLPFVLAACFRNVLLEHQSQSLVNVGLFA
jgi:hypothetical protein